MGSANSQTEACRQTRRNLDAQVSGELDAAAALETRVHTEGCAACAALFEERLRVRELVRRAVRSVETPALLAVAIRAIIRQGNAP